MEIKLINCNHYFTKDLTHLVQKYKLVIECTIVEGYESLFCIQILIFVYSIRFPNSNNI